MNEQHRDEIVHIVTQVCDSINDDTLDQLLDGLDNVFITNDMERQDRLTAIEHVFGKETARQYQILTLVSKVADEIDANNVFDQTTDEAHNIWNQTNAELFLKTLGER